MNAVVQQLPALLGVLIGAMGSFAVVMTTERARFRREQVARWDDRRLHAYADYARALKESITIAMRMAANLGNDPHPHPIGLDEGMAALADVIPRREAAWETVLLLGMPEPSTRPKIGIGWCGRWNTSPAIRSATPTGGKAYGTGT
jgi:hypothetical protein